MSIVFKKRDIKSALERKGFVKGEGKPHEFYVLMVNGRQSGIQTKFSHVSGEYSGKLLSYIRKQLGFNSITELKDFIECPLSKDEYVRILEDKNQI